MSFSDDGWGVHESEVNVAAPPKANIVEDNVEVKVLEYQTNTSNDTVKENVVVFDKMINQFDHESNHEVKSDTGDTVCARQEPIEETNNAGNRSDDGWGTPLKKEEYRAPVVSKAAASRLPPSRVQVVQTTVPPPVDDTLDIESPRELSPVPPVERRILPPQVKSTSSSRKGSDFERVANDVKTFGTQKVSAPVADTHKSSWPSDELNSSTKSFGTQKPNEIDNKMATTENNKNQLKPTSFGGVEKSVGFGGAFGAQKNVSTELSSRLAEESAGKSIKPAGFGGSFGGTKPSEFGLQKPTNDFVEKDTPIKSFGSTDPKTASGFGSSASTRTSFGGPPTKTSFGGAIPPSFGASENKPTSFGGIQIPAKQSELSSSSLKPSGFGGTVSTEPIYASAEKDHGFSNKKQPGFGETFGNNTKSFGGQPSDSFGAQQKPSGFGFNSNTSSKPSGFGGLVSTEPIDASVEKDHGFSNKKQPGFGETFGNNTKSFGGQPSDSFGAQQKPSGFGFNSNASSKPFGFGNTNSTLDEMGSSAPKTMGFGNATGSSSNNTGFGHDSSKARSSFGSFGGNAPKTIGFGGPKIEAASGGFGKSESSENNAFGSGVGNSKNTSFRQGFGGADSTFGGGAGQFGKIDSGFGESDQKKGFGMFDGGNRSTGGDYGGRPTGCRNCGEEGHFARDCPQPKVERPCRNCNEVGHFSRDCPQPKVPFGPCRNCGEEGHFSKECTKERVRLEPTEPCRRCGEEGHWGYECPSRPRDLQGNILVPYDVVFTPETDMFEEAVNNDHRIDFDQKIVASMGEVDIPDMASFEEFKVLPVELHDNLRRMKMNRPTPIQRAAFFPILHGQDVVACAHTGSGKTLAFLIPLVINLLEDRSNHHNVTDEKPSPRLLIVAPTRELANQTFNTARQLAYETGLKCGLAYGGYSRSANLQHLRGFDQLGILVATMGRLQDFIASGDVTLSKMKFVVLDEADRMVDSSDFGEEVCKILGPPEERKNQTILFSASFSEHLQAEDLPKIVKQGYTMLQVDKFGTANEKIDQQMLAVARADKRTELYKLLGIDENTMSILPDARIENEKTLIFVNSVKFCDTLASNISNCGVSCIPVRLRNRKIRINMFYLDAQSSKSRTARPNA
ncbi:hypothetical protein CAEBREN_32053 [Caenorhabditis brenneri]|uniref:Uncharacterized protein n=1 Tax=Caenorhabditis brenneri TaxID=135651 RepID=G0NJJ3_CAEBE|nr:hypothetical protein CAEBREN_32053 [Caenorhabditis brenneri]